MTQPDELDILRASWASDIERLDALDNQITSLRKNCRGWLQKLDVLIRENAELKTDVKEKDVLLAKQNEVIARQASENARLIEYIDQLHRERRGDP